MDKKSTSPPPSKKQKCEPSEMNAVSILLKKISNRKFISKSARYVKKYPQVEKNDVYKPHKIISFEDIVIFSPTTSSSEKLVVLPSSSKDVNSEETNALSLKVGTTENLLDSSQDSTEDFNLNFISDVGLENLTDLSETQNAFLPKIITKNSSFLYKDSSEHLELDSISDIELENLTDMSETQNAFPPKAITCKNSFVSFKDSSEHLKLDSISDIELEDLIDLSETLNASPSKVGASNNLSVPFEISSENFNVLSDSDAQVSLSLEYPCSAKFEISKDFSVSSKDSSEVFNLHSISDIPMETLADLSGIQNSKVSNFLMSKVLNVTIVRNSPFA